MRIDVVRRLVAASLAIAAFLPTAANAAVTVNLFESGSDVNATLSGSLNVGTPYSTVDVSGSSGLFPALAGLAFATGPVTQASLYPGLTGPASFGDGLVTFATTSSGDVFSFSIKSDGNFFLPSNYVSGTPLSATATYAGQTFASLGITPGIYTYSTDRDSIILDIGDAPASVPEPATWAMMLVGFAGVGGAMRRKRTAVLASA